MRDCGYNNPEERNILISNAAMRSSCGGCFHVGSRQPIMGASHNPVGILDNFNLLRAGTDNSGLRGPCTA